MKNVLWGCLFVLSWGHAFAKTVLVLLEKPQQEIALLSEQGPEHGVPASSLAVDVQHRLCQLDVQQMIEKDLDKALQHTPWVSSYKKEVVQLKDRERAFQIYQRASEDVCLVMKVVFGFYPETKILTVTLSGFLMTQKQDPAVVGKDPKMICGPDGPPMAWSFSFQQHKKLSGREKTAALKKMLKDVMCRWKKSLRTRL